MSVYGTLTSETSTNKKSQSTPMDSAKTELADKLKNANNILVTVSRDPSVDQLSACIGLTLLLNKLGKHTAAVFSGQVPSTLEFLKPGDTLEKNTDSLRDFIIALDKSKADKLRYKVEDNVVRIFITPYRTSISQADLEFSQGDFNVDVVVALGVQRQEDLDAAITAHGRILHDATVTSINTSEEGGLGSINWTDKQASSLGELVTELAQTIGSDLIDSQIATALLTGIVAETNRFSNNKTSSQTMSASAALMAAGANQQLVATKLEETGSVTALVTSKDSDAQQLVTLSGEYSSKTNDGMLDVKHDAIQSHNSSAVPSLAEQIPELELPSPGNADQVAETAVKPEDYPTEASKLVTEAPTMGGTLTANTQPEELDPSTDPLSTGSDQQRQLLDHTISQPNLNTEQANGLDEPSDRPMFNSYTPSAGGFTPPPPSWNPTSSDVPLPNSFSADADGDQTLIDLEESVHSPHLSATHLDNAREEVSRALSGSEMTPEPIQALNAQQLGDVLHSSTPTTSEPNLQPLDSINPTDAGQQEPNITDPTAPPPVPPPIPFQFKPPGQ